MSKSSSSSDPVEFQFELDIGEDVPLPPSAKPQKAEVKAEEDDPGDYVILKRKARKGKAKKLDSGKAETDKGQLPIGEEHEAGSPGFMPRKLDGELVVEVPDQGGSPRACICPSCPAALLNRHFGPGQSFPCGAAIGDWFHL